MQSLIFASNNQHKADEIRHVLGNKVSITTLKEAGIFIEIPEPYDTLEKNAVEKLQVIYALTNKDCFSEDTGLEVLALGGAPGVRSARYAENSDFEDNIAKLLFNLQNAGNREAQFRTVISLQYKGNKYDIEGICKGKITLERMGNKGFGYDPVFVPDGSIKTFAEMDLDEKSIYSHRRKATDLLAAFLKAREKTTL